MFVSIQQSLYEYKYIIKQTIIRDMDRKCFFIRLCNIQMSDCHKTWLNWMNARVDTHTRVWTANCFFGNVNMLEQHSNEPLHVASFPSLVGCLACCIFIFILSCALSCFPSMFVFSPVSYKLVAASQCPSSSLRSVSALVPQPFSLTVGLSASLLGCATASDFPQRIDFLQHLCVNLIQVLDVSLSITCCAPDCQHTV